MTKTILTVFSQTRCTFVCFWIPLLKKNIFHISCDWKKCISDYNKTANFQHRFSQNYKNATYASLPLKGWINCASTVQRSRSP